jgi:hypothetical protein
MFLHRVHLSLGVQLRPPMVAAPAGAGGEAGVPETRRREAACKVCATFCRQEATAGYVQVFGITPCDTCYRQCAGLLRISSSVSLRMQRLDGLLC